MNARSPRLQSCNFALPSQSGILQKVLRASFAFCRLKLSWLCAPASTETLLASPSSTPPRVCERTKTIEDRGVPCDGGGKPRPSRSYCTQRVRRHHPTERPGRGRQRSHQAPNGTVNFTDSSKATDLRRSETDIRGVYTNSKLTERVQTAGGGTEKRRGATGSRLQIRSFLSPNTRGKKRGEGESRACQ